MTVSPVVTVLVELNTTHESQSTGQSSLAVCPKNESSSHFDESMFAHFDGSGFPLQTAVVVVAVLVLVVVVSVVVVVDVVSTQVSHSTGQFRRVTAPNNALLQNESSVPHACGSGVPLQASVVVVVVVFVVVVFVVAVVVVTVVVLLTVVVLVSVAVVVLTVVVVVDVVMVVEVAVAVVELTVVVVAVNVVVMQVSQSTGHRARRFSPMKSCWVHLSCKSDAPLQSLGSGFPLHVIVVVVVDETVVVDTVVVVPVAVVVTHVSHSTGQFCFATAPKKASSHSDASEPHELPSGSPLHVARKRRK